MKKITKLFATYLAVFALLLVPLASVSAQTDEDPITIDDEFGTQDVTDAEDEETEEVAGIPDTGFGPTDNPAAANLAIFIGGSALGGALGLGVVMLRKKASQQ